jgi:hypothetical protein
LNSEEYGPKFWKPGHWFLTNIDREVSLFKRQKTLTFFKNLKPKIVPSTAERRKNMIKINSEKYIDVNYLMKNDIRIEDTKFYEDNDFGSHLYVIRSFDFIDERESIKSSSPTKRLIINSSKILPPLETIFENKDKNSLKIDEFEMTPKKMRKNRISKGVKFTDRTNLTPMSTKTSSTLITKHTWADKSIVSKFSENKPNEETSKPRVYNDLIKQMHENKRRLVNSGSILETKHSKKLPDFDRFEFKLNKDRSAPSAFTSVSNPTFSKFKSVSFRNNDMILRNQLLEKLSGRTGKLFFFLCFSK